MYTTGPHGLDSHARPPEAIQNVYKRYQKLNQAAIFQQADLIDASGDSGINLSPLLIKRSGSQSLFSLHEHSCDFMKRCQPSIIYEVQDLPGKPLDKMYSHAISEGKGLLVCPNLFDPSTQLQMLNKLLHRDLSNSEHHTNVHMHYHVPYPSTPQEKSKPASFFDRRATDLVFRPKDPSVHKSISTEQFLQKKLRWATLGGQYDWTEKVYPDSPSPEFPADLKALIEGTFPMKAEAAIVNLYSPGDTLSLHRDVSEECGQPLVSISLGCEGIFVVGLDSKVEGGKPSIATIRLRSGDALLMSGECRFAWHGVPKILSDTCPHWMQDWPFNPDPESPESYEHWRGWIKCKRINLNVRQIYA